MKFRNAKLFFVEEFYVKDMTFSFEQRVEKGNEDRLRHLLSEDALESHVDERINKFPHSLFDVVWVQRYGFSVELPRKRGKSLNKKRTKSKRMCQKVCSLAKKHYLCNGFGANALFRRP